MTLDERCEELNTLYNTDLGIMDLLEKGPLKLREAILKDHWIVINQVVCGELLNACIPDKTLSQLTFKDVIP